MTKEWTDKWNSFNSKKGLMYKQWYDAILEGKFLPPVEVNIDPVNACNLNCVWCNNKQTKARNVSMTRDHFLGLIRFFKDWGVKGICIAGGGEPVLHPNLDEAFYLCRDLNMPVSILTNGLFTSEEQLKACAVTCRWIGVSMDSGCASTYQKYRGAGRFKEALINLNKLVNYGAREVMYKFLIVPGNQNEILDAITHAFEMGCHGIHIRPVSFRNYQDVEDKYDIEDINKQVEIGRKKFESNSFKIFFVQHKHDKDLHVKFPFKKCLATPIMGIFEANGDIMLCIDRKNEQKLCIGKHDDINKIREIWGSEQHKKVIDNIILSECPKCTIHPYQEQIEKGVIENKMDWEFV